MLLVPTIRSVSHKNKLFKHFQFIRLQLAHFSDSGSDDLNPNSLNSCGVVKILKDMQKEPISALSFFNQPKRQGFQHDLQTYLVIIKILCHWGWDRKLKSLFVDAIDEDILYFKVSELLEAMAEEFKAEPEGSNSLLRAFDALVKSYATLGLFYEAIAILSETKRLCVLPCLFSFNFLMSRLVGHGEIKLLEDIYKQMKPALGLTPNVYTYGIMIKGYCRNSRLEEAERAFEEMKKAGVVPDAYAYNAVIQGFVNEKKLEKAVSSILEMEERGLVPNKDNYRALIQGYCDRGDIDNAKDIHDEMVSKGIMSDGFVLTPILQCFCLKGMHNEAVELFLKIKKKGIFLDEVAYNVAIDAFCKMGRLNEALRLFGEMKRKKNLAADAVHYTTLISGYCLHGDIRDACYLFEEMIRNGLKADVVTYSVLAGGLSRNGLLNRVFSLLDTMRSRGVMPTTATHNMIVEGLCSGGKLREAERYFSNLVDKSTENYASMVNGYCLSNKASDGFKFFLRIPFDQRMLVKKVVRRSFLAASV